MKCLFCEWEMGMDGTVDPAVVVLAFEEHLDEHVTEMTSEIIS